MRVVKHITMVLLGLGIALAILVASTLMLGRSYGSTLTKPTSGALEDVASCCSNVEPYPGWIGRAGLAMSSTLGRVAAVVVYRDGHLMSFPEATSYLARHLQPLDLIAIQSDGHLSHAMLPGKFGHIAVYLGSEAELRALGLWEHPAIAAQHDLLKNSRAILEADRKGVHLATFRSLYDADSMALLRPQLTEAKRLSALKKMVSQIGTPFDFRFDAEDGTRLFCAELIAQAIPELQLPQCEAYGRFTILPDQVAYLATANEGQLSLEAYAYASEESWEKGDAASLRKSLDLAWEQPVFR